MVSNERKIIYSKWPVSSLSYDECNQKLNWWKVCLHYKRHLFHQLSNTLMKKYMISKSLCKVVMQDPICKLSLVIYFLKCHILLLLLYLLLTTCTSAMLKSIQRNLTTVFKRQGKERGFTNQYRVCSQWRQIWVPVHDNILNICRKHLALLSLTPWHCKKKDTIE